jgi:hypothetical protein
MATPTSDYTELAGRLSYTNEPARAQDLTARQLNTKSLTLTSDGNIVRVLPRSLPCRRMT